MTFLQNPFQVKFLPVLICMVLGVAAAAVTGQIFKAVAVCGMLAILNWCTADQPLNGLYLYGYIVLAVLSLTFGISLLVTAHALGPAICAFAVAALPLSIVFTRKGNA
jgi:hypothetical protein